MCGGNDATNYCTAKANCAYCALGALLAAKATEVMLDVYSIMGRHPPSGASEREDGAEGFVDFHQYSLGAAVGPRPYLARDTLRAQIKGIEAYLRRKGLATRRLDGRGEFEFLRLSDAVAALREEPEGTQFLALSGDDDGGYGYVSTLAHWTVGQVKSGVAKFYDYQLNISDSRIRMRLARRAAKVEMRSMFGQTRETEVPPGPFGVTLGERAGRALIVVVSGTPRVATLLRTVASGDLQPGRGLTPIGDLRVRPAGAGGLQSGSGHSGPG